MKMLPIQPPAIKVNTDDVNHQSDGIKMTRWHGGDVTEVREKTGSKDCLPDCESQYVKRPILRGVLLLHHIEMEAAENE
jgi:hypothetical protein